MPVRARLCLCLLLAAVVAGVLLVPGAARAQLAPEPEPQSAGPDSAMVQDIHPQDTERDRGLRIVSRDRKVSLRIVGSIRLTGLYDFNGVPGNNGFLPYEIPVGAENVATPRFSMSADQTRFGFELDRRAETLDGDLFARIEADFIAAGQLRLRHAFAQGGRLLVGQTWTTISDVGALPQTIDFEGPNSAITVRNAQVRWIDTVGNSAGWAVAVESPDTQVSQLTEADSIKIENQFLPDITARFRQSLGQSYFQIAGVVRQFTYRATGGDLVYVPGGGIALSGIFHFDETLALLYQGVYGAGISRYLGTFGEKGLDLVPNRDRTELVALPVGGGYMALRLRWAENVSSGLVVGTAIVDKSAYRPDDAYQNGQYLAVNSFWEAVPGVRLGLEYLFGRRENYDGEIGEAHRIQFGSYFDF